MVSPERPTGDDDGAATAPHPSAAPIRVLLVEDSTIAARVVAKTLEDHGLDVCVTRVENRAELAGILAKSTPLFDLVLCDYHLPDIEAPEVLALMSEAYPGVPCIVVTGAVGEEAAAACFRSGARDFILKSNLARIGPAAALAVADARTRNAHRAAAQESARTERRLRQLADSIADVYWVLSPDSGRYIYVSPAFDRVFGRSRHDLMARPEIWLEAVDPRDRPRIQDSMLARSSSSAFAEEYRIVRPDGSFRWSTTVLSCSGPETAAGMAWRASRWT